MTNPKSDVLIAQQGKTRVFFQKTRNPGGAYSYRGKTTLGGVNTPLGDDTLITAPSRTRVNSWDIVDIAPGQPSLPTTDFTAHLDKTLRDIYHELRKTNCRFNIQAKYDSCGRPDDFLSWETKYIGVGARITDMTFPPVNPLSGDDNGVSQLTGSISLFDWQEILKIKFEEQADSVILAELVDGFFEDVVDCGDCGALSDGCQKFYGLQIANTGSPGLSSQLVYTLDGSTWQALDIPTLGGNTGDKMAAVGGRVVVVSRNSNSHHTIRFTDIKAGDSTAWQEVKGYTENPLDIYSLSSGETFVSAENGYVYLLADPTQTPEILTDGSIVSDNLTRINGIGNVVVAGGENGALLVSVNTGSTFANKGLTVSGSTVNDNITAIGMLTDKMWFIGAGGKLYYTIDAGDTYTEKVLDANITVINDIQFYDDNVGYVAVEINGGARVYRTDSMGWNWYYTDGISNLPTMVRANFVAPCGYNKVAVGGRETLGGDGLLAIAE